MLVWIAMAMFIMVWIPVSWCSLMRILVQRCLLMLMTMQSTHFLSSVDVYPNFDFADFMDKLEAQRC